MKIIKKFITVIVAISLLVCLSGCGNFTSKAKSNVDTYMNNLKKLTKENYVEWISENLENPYTYAGLDLSLLREGQIEYFINCLSKMEYEIVNVDETNKYAEVNVTYVDSSEYVVNIFAKILEYAFSDDYTEEGENQIYIDEANAIKEYTFTNDTIYFSFVDNGTIDSVSYNVFDVVTAGFYKIMLGDSSETETQGASYSAEELINNLEIKDEVINESYISVTITNNNEVAVYPIINYCFYDKDGNEIIRSQASVEALPAGATNYSYAYNELSSEGVVGYDKEIEIYYYNSEDITFFDESLIPYEIKQEDDMVSIYFTNNTSEAINICGGYLVYNSEGEVITTNSIYISDLAPGASEQTWFYLTSVFNENTDTWEVEPYERIDIYPIAHTSASYIWCN